MDPKTFKVVLTRAFWVPAAVAAALALVLIAQVQFLLDRSQWVDHTDEVISLAERVYRERVDEETGLRAFLLTRDERFLQPLENARHDAFQTRSELGRLIADNPAQQQKDAAAVAIYNEWAAWADDVISRAKAGKNVDAPEVQLRGKELMDGYRQARSDFIAEEEHLRQERAVSSGRALQSVTFGIVAVCLLSACLLIIFARKQLAKLYQAFTAAVTEIETKAAEVHEQREWFRTTLTSIGDAVIATDQEGRITFMNPVAEELTGWTKEEGKGVPLSQVFHIVNEQTRQPAENPVDMVRRSNKVVGLANHTVLLAKNGKEYLIDDSGAPIRTADSSLAGIVLVFRDVTQQRKLEAGLRSNERLAAAGRLSATIAHEIHNPLDTVGNLLFLINSQASHNPEVQQWVAMAQSELHRVTQISKSMLSLNRESRTPGLVPLAQLLKSITELIQQTIAKGKRTIEIKPQSEGSVEGFSSDLFQVFLNLVKNAVEATGEGGHIVLSSRLAEESGVKGVLVEVQDDGIGIPADLQSKLFTPFISTKGDEGTGLGLWVSRSFVEKHGGTIRVANNSGQGATASVFLPLTMETENGATTPRGISA
jgi:PAS domain S-box-containing protein